MIATLQELVAQTYELASLPETTVRLLRLLDDPTVEAQRLVDVIGSDPAMTANLLKLCNSAYYGRRRQIGSVKEAVVMLGNKTVVTLAFATSMGKVLQGELAGYGLGKDDLWRHSLAVAYGAAAVVTELEDFELRDRAFTAGLVHDIGKLLLNPLLVERLEWSAGETRSLEPFIEVEREALGFDHAEAGAALADSWHLPEALAAAIRWHHDPEAATSHRALAAAVAAANSISAALGVGGEAGGGGGVPLATLARVGVPEEVVQSVATLVSERLDNLTGLLVAV